MRAVILFACGLFLTATTMALAAALADVQKAPKCHICGMDRDKFSHSRMLIDYEDGSTVANCSLHCVAIELANTIDRVPEMVRVADYNTRELLDVEKAVWVLGGNRKGVMTAQAKWAFADRKSAERFVSQYGGSIVTFEEAIKAAYDDMYQDSRMIREFRRMKQNN